ncbi:MAG TPA: hypothetical protein PK095_01860 [Myxococcota bacterium]|nr:hypothetical protein [Myxococcota bacterium]
MKSRDLKALSLPIVLAGVALSCSERELVSIGAAEVSMVSCNGGADPASLALYVDFLVDNEGDEAVEITRVALATEGDGVSRVSGSQAIGAVEVDGGSTLAFACKDGFTVSYPGENTLTDIRLEVTYRQAESEVTMIRYLQMDASIAWDNCGTFLGNARACAPM